jgi:hypothetical protein
MDDIEDDIDTGFGFRIIGDNLDINVKPRYHCVDHGTTSPHFFNLVALRDCIDLSDVSDDSSIYLNTPVGDLETKILLPSHMEYEEMISNYAVLVSTVLVSKLPYFESTFDDIIMKHITHTYTKECPKSR